MRKEDNDCIRYLMKEMDPSEELLMERAMMEDEDLLIEVESMRQTLKKLDKLPRKDPPSDVTDAIMAQAADQAQKNRRSANSSTPIFRYAVAATLALTVTAGGFWLYTGVEDESRMVNSASLVTEQTPSIASTAISASQRSQNDSNVSTTAPDRGVEPWTDRNDVLHFDDFFGKEDSNMKALIQNATQKLNPIDDPNFGNNQVRSLQLTGSKQ